MTRELKLNGLKVFFLLFIIIFPFSFGNNSKNIESKYLEFSTLSYYQTQTCDISFFDFWRENIGNKDVIIRADFFSSIDCFGKVNGVDYLGESYNVYIGTNLNINLLLQSLFWILIISFIKLPRKEFSKILSLKKTPMINLIFISSLFTSQIFSESKFYTLYNKNVDTSITVNNYFVLSIFLALLIVLKISDDVITPRIKTIPNFVPYVFLFIGTYSSANINFYILYFCLLGSRNISFKTLKHRFTIFYIGLSILWILNQESINNYFDVDKIRGFVNSENNRLSLLFWIIVFYLLINGLVYIFDMSYSFIDFQNLRTNFLISGSLTVIFGFIGAFSSYFNFLNFYLFGLNKNGMTSLRSVTGNTWRGFSASAEAIGEFYGIAILISLYFIFKLQKVSLFHSVLIGINFFGLIKTNDAAVLISLILISVIFLISELSSSKKGAIKFLILFMVIFFFVLSLAYSIFNPGISRDYDFLTENLLTESLKNSSYFESENLFMENLLSNSNYRDITYLEDYEEKLSGTTRFLLQNYISDNNISYIPSFSSILSLSSSLINRTDKWGMFVARYDPNLLEFMFGSGPLQYNNFYNSHSVKYIDGLILPHSSVLNTLLFFGVTGVLFCLFGALKIFLKTDSDIKYLLIFYILNLLKSDSVLYVSTFILLSFTVSICMKSIRENSA